MESISNIPFVQDALKDYESAMRFATLIYDSGVYGDTVGNPGEVFVKILFGLERGLTVAQSLTGVILYGDGNFGLQGDIMRAIIMKSGLVADWKETPTGSIEEGTYEFSITCTRIIGSRTANSPDQLLTLTRAFSVKQAVKAKLWISDADAEKSDIKRYDAWYLFPDRQIQYRALGYIGRDLFADLLGGARIKEEADDVLRLINKGYAKKNDLNVHQDNGNRSADINTAAIGKADLGIYKKPSSKVEPGFNLPGKARETPPDNSNFAMADPEDEPKTDPKESLVEEATRILAEKEVAAAPRYDKMYEEKELSLLSDIEVLKNICKDRQIDFESLPGNNSGKKLRDLIIADQQGEEYYNKFLRSHPKYKEMFLAIPRVYLQEVDVAGSIAICYYNVNRTPDKMVKFLVPSDPARMKEWAITQAVYKSILQNFKPELDKVPNRMVYQDKLGIVVHAGIAEDIAKELAELCGVIYEPLKKD